MQVNDCAIDVVQHSYAPLEGFSSRILRRVLLRRQNASQSDFNVPVRFVARVLLSIARRWCNIIPRYLRGRRGGRRWSTYPLIDRPIIDH